MRIRRFVRRSAKSALRSVGIRSTQRHMLQITSFGGSGTSMLYRFATEQHLNVPNSPDWRPWKHMRVPPADNEVRQGFRAIYLFSCPMDAILSVFRRGFQHWLVERIGGDQSSWNSEWTLEGFLEQGQDYFLLEQHVNSWLGAARSYPIMFARLETIWDNVPELFAFMGLPTDSIPQFPENRTRSSNWSLQAERISQQLVSIYGRLDEQLSSLPDIFIH